MQKTLFDKEKILLIGLDLQDKLLPAMFGREKLIKTTNSILQASQAFDVQIFMTEQYPKGLGSTDKNIQINLVPQNQIFEKISFSVFNDEKISTAIKNTGKKTLVFFGIETHICVLQSVIMALDLGYNVWLIEDALSSRTQENYQNALKLMRQFGAKIISSESFIFGLMIDSKDPNFRQMSALIK